MDGQSMVSHHSIMEHTMSSSTMDRQIVHSQSSDHGMENMVDEDGLDESNIDLLHVGIGEKSNHSLDEYPSSTLVKQELPTIERTNSSDSDEVYMKVKDSMCSDEQFNLKGKDNLDEAPVMQRKLFGPPCWNPEQLVAAIESVKNGTSVSASARKFGIPRTTLSNKIYGRRRKLYNTNEGVYQSNNAAISSTGAKRTQQQQQQQQQDSSLTFLIGSENERLIADVITSSHVDCFSMTRAIFDIVKYLAQDKGHLLKDDEEVKEWIQFFFIRYPAAYFSVTLFELRLAHADDEYFADFVFDTSKNETAEEVLKKLMPVITRRLLVEKKVLQSIHLFWWYTFLSTYTDVRDYFLDNLTWPDTILNPANLQTVDDKGVHQILTSVLLKRSHHGVLTSFSELKRQKLLTTSSSDCSSDSPTQVTARRNEVPMSHYENNTSRPSSSVNTYPSSSSSSYTQEDNTSQDSNNISSTSATTSSCLKTPSSLGKMLAQEALIAVERKISSEELRYFRFRYDNPRLEDAYQVWKNLKLASEKEDEPVDGGLI